MIVNSTKTLGAALLLLAATHSPAQSIQPSQNHENLEADRAILLGMGWDRHSESVKGFCVTNAEPDVYYSGVQSSTLNFERSMTEQELDSALDVDVSGKLKLPVFQIKGASKFHTTAKASDLSETLVFSHIIRGKHALIRNTAITEAGKKVAAKAENQDYVRDKCGDSFVSEIELGAKLFIGVKFEFSSREAKSAFEANVDVDYLQIFSVSGAAKTALEQFKNQVRVKIFLYQQGGKPQLASDILNDGEGKGSSIITCSIANRKACLKALENLVQYISSDSPNSFKNQVKEFIYDPTQPGGPAFLTHQTRTYYEAGHNELYPVEGPIIAQAIQNVRTELLLAYDVQSRQHLKAQSLLSMRLSPAERQAISATEQILKSNLTKILTTAKVCYDTPKLCLDAYKQITLATYDPATLVHDNTFLDYCESPGFGKRYKVTVDAILNAAEAGDMSCDRAFETLRQFDKLNLAKSNPPIKDLTPLKGLEHLRILDLEANSVGVIAPLEKFTNLEILYLRNNNVPNLRAIANLPKLKYLDAAYNQIVYLDGFESNQSLETLFLFGNSPEMDPEPVLAIPSLKSLIYSKKVRCNQEVERVVAKGLISKQTGDVHIKYGFAPSYNQPGDINSGIEGFYRCDIVFSAYDPGHGRIGG